MLGRMLLAGLLAGCTSSPEVISGIDATPGGNPLVPDLPLLPFPSDLYLEADPTTATGRRVAIPAEALPADLEPEMFTDADGFSLVPQIVTWFQGGLDPASLPEPEATLAEDAPVQLVRARDGARVPVVAEIDTSTDLADQAALLIRPWIGLEPGETYVVVLTDGLATLDGSSPTASEAFTALRDGIPTDNDAVEAQRDDFFWVQLVLGRLPVAPEEVVLAWPFTTRSRSAMVDPLLAMHDAAMAADLSDWTVVADSTDDDDRIVEGRLSGPDFLGPDNRLVWGDDGLPVAQGTREVPFFLAIPNTVAEPRPVMLFGHGFFSAAEETTWGSLNTARQLWQISALSTPFLGFNEDDLIETASVVAADLAALDTIVDQQLQSHVHFTLLGRLLQEELGAAYPDLVDPSAVPYLGISNGGTQGSVIATFSPVIERAALVVPGGGWSHIMQRATQWNELGALLAARYDDPRDLQLAIALTQQVFDRLDAMSFAPHLVHDRLPDRPPIKVTMHEAVGDCQVPNLVTEMVARTAGVALVTPSARPIWGLEEVGTSPDVDGALFVYDEGYPPLPEGNVAPAEDNGAHATIRELDAYLEQVGAFLQDGTIAQVCDGPCDPD